MRDSRATFFYCIGTMPAYLMSQPPDPRRDRDHRARMEPDEPGELVVRGAGLMQGYYGDPEATTAWMPDGWARTGDLVIRDDEGRYRLVGRLKDMIRRASENISAAEVEAVLSLHPAVRTAACIPVPDPMRGEEV